MGRKVDHQRAAATAICRELQASKVENVTAQVELSDKSKPFSPVNWDRAVPENAVLIRIGPAKRPLLERKRMESNGMGWILALEQKSDQAMKNLEETLGRKGPCEPGGS